MERIECLKILAEERKGGVLLTSVGPGAREAYSIDHRETNLYNVQMSYASPMALGIAMALPQIPVIVCDGDGSTLMGLGALTTIAEANPKNLKMFVFDNECYSGPGRFPTATAGKADLEVIARGAGIKNSATARDLEEFRKLTKQAFRVNELFCIVVKVEKTEKLRPEIKPDPCDLMENTFLVRQALAKDGLIETWRDFFKGRDIY